jgi:hypothetical protein
VKIIIQKKGQVLFQGEVITEMQRKSEVILKKSSQEPEELIFAVKLSDIM